MRFALLLVCLFFTACTTSSGPATVACSGTLLKDGQPLVVAQEEIGVGMVSLEFIPIETTTPTTERYGVKVSKDGTFSHPDGIPPGKYKISVRQWDPYPNVDKLQGAFADDKSPLIRTIDGKSPIEIELSKPQ